MIYVTDARIPTSGVRIWVPLGIHARSASFGRSAFRYLARHGKVSCSSMNKAAITYRLYFGYCSIICKDGDLVGIAH